MLMACSGSAGEDSAPTSVGEGAERLRFADAAAAPGGVWVVGGSVISDDIYEAVTEVSVVPDPDAVAEAAAGSNQLLVQYRSDGTVRETLPLPLDSEALFDADVATVDDRVVVAGVTCSGPSAYGCGTDARPFAAVVADGEAREPDLGTGWPANSHAWLETFSIVGVVDGEVVVVGDIVDTVHPPGDVRAFAIDPATAAVRPLSLPEGVQSAWSVCAGDDRLVAVTPLLTESGGDSPVGLEVWAGDAEAGSAMQRSGGLVPLPAEFAETTHRFPSVCTAELVAVGFVGDPRVLLLDTASGSLVTTIDIAGRDIQYLLADRDQIVLARDDAQSSETRLQRWTRHNGLSDMSDRVAFDRRLVLVDGRVVDVTALLEHVPGSDGPALTELS